ncbi:hypothetical protein F4779DRAFT_596341 [Xylariaceae sp. FL0662B]|nr:hypothetical protein F4779DRAFT_596341 [Xylariaceae sp. FL0662B]
MRSEYMASGKLRRYNILTKQTADCVSNPLSPLPLAVYVQISERNMVEPLRHQALSTPDLIVAQHHTRTGSTRAGVVVGVGPDTAPSQTGTAVFGFRPREPKWKAHEEFKTASE